MSDTGATEATQATDELLVERDGPVLRVTFNRPTRRNAMTWAMYDGLLAACDRAESDSSIRVMVLRGAGDEAFVAGTDIGQFGEFTGGDAGVAYEQRMTRLLETVSGVRVPTVAVLTGYCVGAGLAIAASCDLRIAARGARFGVPIARTVGNCLSTRTVALLVDNLGPARTLDMVLRARLLDETEVAAAGFLSQVCEPEDVDAEAEVLVARLVEHAPLTMWATKQAVRRIMAARVPDDTDLVHRVYDSADFRAGVAAFVAKQRPSWTGT
ncbi:enoyl-CoA hydratase/isomerase family protein [Actinopolymorpha sp. NPDC004070]|uniref:enoyl-CoA hydratase/isomerase family protein n=1 Tax=Actinopolymorpha sp. NPDC004070 TaxID=3154548 RepID=UPI0033BB502C